MQEVINQRERDKTYYDVKKHLVKYELLHMDSLRHEIIPLHINNYTFYKFVYFSAKSIVNTNLVPTLNEISSLANLFLVI